MYVYTVLTSYTILFSILHLALCYRLNSLRVCLCVCLCLFLVDPSQGLPGPPGPEGAEGKPGTQVPILYHISIPSPVNALCVCLCVLYYPPHTTRTSNYCSVISFFFNIYNSGLISHTSHFPSWF